MKTKKRQLHRHLTFIHHRLAQQSIGIIAVVIVAAFGIHFLAGSHATTTLVDIEAENGTLGSAATKVSSSTASNGSYVQFGSTSTTSVAAMVNGLKLINYFPSANSWEREWTSFNPTQMDTDFAGIAKLGGNAVRLSIDPDDFGWPTPNSTSMANFAQVVGLAKAHNLKVEITLFSEWGRYTETAQSDTWIDAFLAPYHNDSEIAFVELQNELKPTDPSSAAWMQHEIPVLRATIGTVPITVSVNAYKDSTGTQLTDAQSLADLIAATTNTPLDFYDIHYYGAEGGATPIFEASKNEAGGKPVWVGETGYSSWDGNTSTGTTQEAQQDRYIRNIAYAAQVSGLPYIAPWTYIDFEAGQGGANPVAGSLVSGNFTGLLRLDGSYKPAATSIQNFFTKNVLDTSYNGDFTQSFNSLPLYWQTQDASQGTLDWDGTVGHTALGSVSLSGTSSSANAVPNFQSIPIANLKATARTVTASTWAKGTNTTGTNVLDIAFFDNNGVFISNKNSTSLPSGSLGWTQLSLTATAPTNASYFQIAVQSANNSGTVWFDDVSSSVQ